MKSPVYKKSEVEEKFNELTLEFKGFKAVFSEEIADRSSIVLEAGRNKKSQVGTISYLPASFGCACAQAVITGLLGV